MPNSLFESFDPAMYAKFAFAAREASFQMDTRLNLMKINPRVIVDAGCGVGESSAFLKKRYEEATVLAADSALSFAQYGKKINLQGVRWVAADAAFLPLKDYTIDLIFANFLLPWCETVEIVLSEFSRILKPNGLLMFSALGLDTLKELNSSIPILPHLIDMHDIGDILLKVGYKDPVMDVETIKLNYSTTENLFNELVWSGMIEKNDVNLGTKSATYEIIYGHAWGNPMSKGEVRISIDQIKRPSKE